MPEQPPSPELALQELRVAAGPREALDAVEALRSALWERMLAALDDPSAGEVAELADRLGALSSALLRCALTAAGSVPHPSAARPEPAVAGTRGGAPGEARAGVGPHHVASPGLGGLLIDDPGEPLGRPGWAPYDAPPTRGSARSGVREGDIRARDERERGGDARPWMRAISAELLRFEHDHRPFAVLLFELRDLARLRLALAPAELRGLSGLLGAAIAELLAADPELPAGAAVRPGEPIEQEPGRHWLLVPGADPTGARALAARIAAGLPTRSRSGAARGEVLTGVAACPAHGRSATALATFAEVDLYAARGPFAARA